MKRDPVAEALQALSEVAGRPHDAATLALVRGSLAHRSNHVVARAARAAREADLSPLAFGDAAGSDVFLRGAVHVQREPAFGPPVDTAPELRATSAMALVVTGHPAALTICVGLLVDPEPTARAGGIRGLVASGRPDVALL